MIAVERVSIIKSSGRLLEVCGPSADVAMM